MNIEGFLGWPQVLALIPVSKRDLQRRIAAGTFPKPEKLGRRALFDPSKICAFIEKLKNGGKS